MPSSTIERTAGLFAEGITLGLSDRAGVVVAGEAATAPNDDESTVSRQGL